MNEEKLEGLEEELLVNDPPENEEDKSAETPVNSVEVSEDEDPLAPVGEGDPKPIDADGG